MGVKNTSNALYFQPLLKNRSNLQIIKANCRSFHESTNTNIPANSEEIKNISNRNHALSYLKLKTNNEIKSKIEYCKRHNIATNTLNKGLALIGSRSDSTRGGARPGSGKKPKEVKSTKNFANQSKPIRKVGDEQLAGCQNTTSFIDRNKI